MHLLEPIEVINKRLIDYYGLFESGQARFRVVWSDDEIEKTFTNFTPEGFELPYKILRESPKYKQWIQHKYILERLTVVPEFQQLEVGTKLSYEPLWVFEDAHGFPLPPKWEVIQALLKSIQEQLTRKNRTPYKQDEKDGNTLEALEYKAEKLEEALFGNESKIGDALTSDAAVGYGERKRNDTQFNNNPIKLD